MKEHRVPLDGVRLSRSYRINGDALNPAETLDADALREPPEMEVDGIGDEGDVRRIAVDERSWQRRALDTACDVRRGDRQWGTGILAPRRQENRADDGETA